MGGKDLLEQVLSLLGELDRGPATIGLDFITLNQSFRFQTIQYAAGKGQIGFHQRPKNFEIGVLVKVRNVHAMV